MANKKNRANVAIRGAKSNPARNKIGRFIDSELRNLPGGFIVVRALLPLIREAVSLPWRFILTRRVSS
jgi:hypothetical protein